MAPIAVTREVREIPLDQLEIGLGQVRTKNVSKDIEELAESIQRVGLLEPIVVCEAETPGKYQILTGQRRYQAVRSLGQPTIKAMVIDRKVSEPEAKIISLTENAVRLDLTRPEITDAVSYLYYHYNQSIPAVAEATGLAPSRIRSVIKFDRLVPVLKEMVRSGDVHLDAALKAQDAASVGQETPDVEEAVQLARAMNPMTNYQRDKIRKDRAANPETPLDEVIEESTSGGFVTQIIIGMSGNTLGALQQYAQAEGLTQSDAAAALIEVGLSGAGYLE